MYLFAIYDRKAETFDNPFPAANAQVASRMFSDLVNRDDNMIGQHPEDFELHQVGFFDPATGFFVRSPNDAAEHLSAYDSRPPLQPEIVCQAVSLLKAAE